MKDIIAKPYQ